MEPESGSIAHDRLYEAAERVMALANTAAAQGGGWVRMSIDTRDDRLQGLSQDELDEGIRFLVRLGFIELTE